MIGSIIGDIIGSVYEFNNTDSTNFELFKAGSTYTDDSILTIATADVLLNGGDYSKTYTEYFKAFPNRGWGMSFYNTIKRFGSLQPYNSYGNGSAMRVSPIGWYYNNVQDVLNAAFATAEVSHSHTEGIKGAQAIALAILLARKGCSKEDICHKVSNYFSYDLSGNLNKFARKKYDITCQGTVPICLTLFRESENFEDAMRKTVYLGGDVDTNACIVGGMMEAFHGEPPKEYQKKALSLLTPELRTTAVQFIQKYVYNDYKMPELTKQEDLVNLFRGLFSN